VNPLDLNELTTFVVRAKTASYAGDGATLLPYRLGSHDLQFLDGDWAYHDSYFGGTDFIGQEIAYYRGVSIWGQNYFGRILRDELMTGEEAGRMIKESLSALYAQGRFLGGFRRDSGELRYVDTNQGNVAAFSGAEWIERADTRVYELVYHGGLIRP